MSTGPKHWYHSNGSTSSTSCEHCKGVLRHETWCITRNANTAYAYRAVLDSDNLSQEDKYILHALGVSWIGKSCDCETRENTGGILPQ
jgi:hypothetical protein